MSIGAILSKIARLALFEKFADLSFVIVIGDVKHFHLNLNGQGLLNRHPNVNNCFLNCLLNYPKTMANNLDLLHPFYAAHPPHEQSGRNCLLRSFCPFRSVYKVKSCKDCLATMPFDSVLADSVHLVAFAIERH